MRVIRFGLVVLGALLGLVLFSPYHLGWNPLTRPVVSWFLSAVAPPCGGGTFRSEDGTFTGVMPMCVLPLWVRITFLVVLLAGVIGGALLTARLTRQMGRRSEAVPS